MPDATQITRVVAGTAVAGAFSRTFQRALAIAAERCSASISVQVMRTSVTPGSAAGAGAHVALELGPQRAARRGEGDGHGDHAVAVDLRRAGHAEIDDVAAQLGVDDAAQGPQDVLGGRRAHLCRAH